MRDKLQQSDSAAAGVIRSVFYKRELPAGCSVQFKLKMIFNFVVEPILIILVQFPAPHSITIFNLGFYKKKSVSHSHQL